MRIASSTRILHLRGFDDVISKVARQVAGGAQIHLASPEQIRKLDLHGGDAQETGNVRRVELDEQIDIAVRARCPFKLRAEQRQAANVVSFAKPSDRGFIEIQAGVHENFWMRATQATASAY
jgi:hypothetical protein